MNVGYTRDMEKELDKVEEDHLDWVQMLHRFYNPFKKALKEGEKNLVHAKAETVPAPEQYLLPRVSPAHPWSTASARTAASSPAPPTPTARTPALWIARACLAPLLKPSTSPAPSAATP